MVFLQHFTIRRHQSLNNQPLMSLPSSPLAISVKKVMNDFVGWYSVYVLATVVGQSVVGDVWPGVGRLLAREGPHYHRVRSFRGRQACSPFSGDRGRKGRIVTMTRGLWGGARDDGDGGAGCGGPHEYHGFPMRSEVTRHKSYLRKPHPITEEASWKREKRALSER